jgi:hypothetical protein
MAEPLPQLSLNAPILVRVPGMATPAMPPEPLVLAAFYGGTSVLPLCKILA